MNERPPPLHRIPPAIAAVEDYRPFARERLGEAAWAYFDGAAADETTAADNRAAFGRLRLAGRVLADLAGGDTALTLFGQTLAHPIVLAPVAYQTLAHPDGERASALAAAAMGGAMVVSTQAGLTLEEIAAATPAPLWFQLYIQTDRAFTRRLVGRAEAAGYRALVVTVDAPVSGVRNREQRAGFALPPGIEAVNLRGLQAPPAAAAGRIAFGTPLLEQAPTWRDLDWLRSITTLPILAKGILCADDATRAIAHGVDGVIVSNHGGRTLDTLPATIDALPAVAAAVGGRVPLLLDGGIRRGTDVLKALALGASAVLIGRPYVYGLAAAGASGVAHVLQILRTELELAMALTGRRRLADVDATAIWRG